MLAASPVRAVRRAVAVAIAVAFGSGRVRDLDPRQLVDVRHLPRLGPVGEVAVGQQEHRAHEPGGDPHGLDRHVEAVGRRLRGDDRHRALAVAAEHRLQQVGLLGLGRQAGARAAALHVDDDERQFGHDGQADRLGLQADARAAGAGDADRPAEAAPMATPMAAISSSAWKVLTPNRFMSESECRMSLAGVIG